ncbi:MAG: hypothetical protein ABH873_10075 [Candidatus Firestonebacteria bacterium]
MLYKKIILLLILICAVGFCNDNDKQHAYLVGGRKIYVVDIEKGELSYVSEEMKDIGYPVSFDIDRKNNILYIACHQHEHYFLEYPVIGIDLKTMKIIKKFKLDNDSNNSYEAYQLRIIPSDLLVVLYGDGNPNLDVILDPETGNIINRRYVTNSPDDIFNNNSAVNIMAWHVKDKIRLGFCIRFYRDIMKDEKPIFTEAEDLYKSGQGLNPPWGKIEKPLLLKSKEGVIKLVDRMTGNTTDIIDLSNHGYVIRTDNYNSFFPIDCITSDNNRFLIREAKANISGEYSSYLLIIGIKEKKILNEIKIDGGLSNIIVK